jgi:hypothetical protein
MKSSWKIRLAATAGSIALWSPTAIAQEAPVDADAPASTDRSATYLDLTAGLGYSSNPRMQFGDGQGSAFGRVSARGFHSMVGERTSGVVTGFVEASSYFQDYGVESIFAVDGNVSHEASEKVTLFGSVGFSGDISGQLSNRFLYTPPNVEVPDPNLPPPVTVEDPDFFGFAGRQYRLYGQTGASIRVSERGRVSISGGAQRVFYTEDLLNDYTSVFGTVSYDHTLSERTSVGVSTSINRTDYDNSGDSSTIVNPSVYIRTQLAENLEAQGSIGVAFSSVERDGSSDNSTNISGDASLCRTTETERLCGRVSRYSAASSQDALVTTSSIGVDWFKRLDADQTIQLSASAVRYAVDDLLPDTSASQHYRVAASYSRRINGRLSAGADLGARTLRVDGPDPDPDFTGSLFVRYRLGDLG